jgi:hypothetical protein
MSSYQCDKCEEVFFYHDEVVFLDGAGFEIDYDQACETGHDKTVCITCNDKED